MRHSRLHPGAIVIGGDYRGLGVVRSLGRRGIPVWVLYDEHRLAGLSRYAQRSFPWPTQTNRLGQVAYLLHLAQAHQLDDWTLFPTGDETAALLARHHKQLSQHFRVTTPPWQVFRWAYDKRLTYHLAGRLGIGYPWTRYPRDRATVAALKPPFPVILKPAIKPEANALTVAKAWRVDNQRELLPAFDAASLLMDKKLIMIQELIPGGGESQLSFATLCVKGQPRARIVARRIRQYPMDFGRASTYVESTEDPLLEVTATRLLAAMQYTGLVEVEFKRDARDGEPKLLDVNPRVWGWHTLGRRAGTDFAHLQWRLSHGETPAAARTRAGLRWVRLTTDVPTALSQAAQGKMSPGDYLRSLRGDLEYATMAADDPLPAMAELPLQALQGAARALSRRRSNDLPRARRRTPRSAVTEP